MVLLSYYISKWLKNTGTRGEIQILFGYSQHLQENQLEAYMHIPFSNTVVSLWVTVVLLMSFYMGKEFCGTSDRFFFFFFGAFPHLFPASMSFCLFIPLFFALPSSSVRSDAFDSWRHSCGHSIQNTVRMVAWPYGARVCVRYCRDIERMTNCFPLYVITGMFWRIAL